MSAISSINHNPSLPPPSSHVASIEQQKADPASLQFSHASQAAQLVAQNAPIRHKRAGVSGDGSSLRQKTEEFVHKITSEADEKYSKIFTELEKTVGQRQQEIESKKLSEGQSKGIWQTKRVWQCTIEMTESTLKQTTKIKAEIDNAVADHKKELDSLFGKFIGSGLKAGDIEEVKANLSKEIAAYMSSMNSILDEKIADYKAIYLQHHSDDLPHFEVKLDGVNSSPNSSKINEYLESALNEQVAQFNKLWKEIDHEARESAWKVLDSKDVDTRSFHISHFKSEMNFERKKMPGHLKEHEKEIVDHYKKELENLGLDKQSLEKAVADLQHSMHINTRVLTSALLHKIETEVFSMDGIEYM